MTWRRRVRTLIVASVATSFVVTATLFLALMIADDSTRLCRDELDQLQSTGNVRGHQSSVLRQLNIALTSNNDKLPVIVDVNNVRTRSEKTLKTHNKLNKMKRNESAVI